MNRVMIIGCSGAGKSTLAKTLHQATQLPLIHLDQQYWLPNWTEPRRDSWTQKVIQLADQDQWIIDGNYGGTLDIRIKRADTIIYLDYSRWVCLWQVIKRTIHNYGQTRNDMASGCKERFNLAFLNYVYTFNDIKRPVLLKKLQQVHRQQKVYILKNRMETQNFLEQL